MRVAWFVWSAAVGVLLLADSAMVLAVGGGLNAGTLLPGAAGAGLIAGSWFLRGRRSPFGSAGKRNMSTALCTVVAIGLISVAAIEGLIAASAFPGGPVTSRWLVVLGAGLRGGNPSLTLQQRLYTALDYLKHNPDTKAVVSGGQGRGETMSEAQAMFRFLTERGVAPDRLIKEDRSTSTFENLRFCKKILDVKGLKADEAIAVISSDFHLFRVKFLAKRAGLPVRTIAAPSPWYLLPNTCMREFFAVIKSFALDK